MKVCVHTSDTFLLSQRTQIVGTSEGIDFTEKYKKQMIVPEGGQPTKFQWDQHHHRREYVVPTMNRGQKLRFAFLNTLKPELLNTSKPEKEPIIRIDVLHKGVLCKFQIEKNQFLGVPKRKAVIVGTLVCLVVVGLIVMHLKSLPWAASFSFIIGLLVVVPGVYVIKTYRKIRDFIIG